MRRIGRLLAALGLVALICTPVQASDIVPASMVRGLFPGSFEAVVRGYTVTFVAKAGGRLIGEYRNMTDTGRWSIRRGRLCIMLSDWMDGKTTCSHVKREGSWFLASDVKFRRL